MEPNDAWSRIPAAQLKATEAVVVMGTGAQERVFRFRYRRKQAAWQLSRRSGDRWVTAGPPSAAAGELLGGIIRALVE